MDIRYPPTSVVYATGYLNVRIVQLRIFDTSTWTIVPSGAEELVGRRDGARNSDVSSLSLPDASLQPTTLPFAREFESPC